MTDLHLIYKSKRIINGRPILEQRRQQRILLLLEQKYNKKIAFAIRISFG